MKFECLLPEGFAWTQRNFTGLNQVGDKFSIGSIISHYQLLSWAFILSSTNILNTKKFKYEQFVQDGFPKWPAEFWIQKKKKKMSLHTKYESETSTITCTSVHITLS